MRNKQQYKHSGVDRPLVTVSLQHTNHERKLMLCQRSRASSHLSESFHGSDPESIPAGTFS